MKIKEYQKLALERLNPNIAKKDKESMKFCCMGLMEEAGEVIAELRKPLYKGNYHEKALDKEAIKKELGDLIWYMALTCKNNDININNIIDKEKKENKENVFDREKIIKRTIKMGRQSGIISKRYIEYYKGKTTKEKLEKSLKKQYKNILKVCNMLDISINSVLEANIEKVTNRYDKDGRAKIGGEDNER